MSRGDQHNVRFRWGDRLFFLCSERPESAPRVDHLHERPWVGIGKVRQLPHSSFGLFFARPFKQSRGFHFHCDRQAVDDVDHCDVNRPSQRADVGAVEAGAMGELFLREPFCLPCSPQVFLQKSVECPSGALYAPFPAH